MHLSSPVLIGRAAELSLLGDRLAATARPSASPVDDLGLGRAVFLCGEAGIGKTRLAAECSTLAYTAGQPVLRGRCGATAMTMPFRPLVEAMASLFRASGPPADPALLPYRPALSRLIPEWRAGQPNSTLTELAEALLRLLTVIGGENGCLLVLEDLHDADAESLAVLDYLISNLSGVPVLLVGTLRPHPSPALELARAAERGRTAEVLTPRQLSAAEIGELAAACLGTSPAGVPAPVLRSLVRDCDGNPFVVEELLSGMAGSGVLHREGQGWRLAGPLGSKVPTTVVRSIGDRVGRLGPQVQDMLRTAAVLGHQFTVPALGLASGLDERTLLSQLREAAQAQIIVPDSTGTDGYSFRHALTSDALLAELMPAERAVIARRAADALEAAEPVLSDEWCQLAAGLRIVAGQPESAAVLLSEAGRRVLASGSSVSALTLLERAFDLHPSPGLTETLVQALAEGGQLDRALDLVRELGPPSDVAGRAELHTSLAWAAGSAGRPEDAAAQVALARGLLGPDAGPGETAALDVVEARLVWDGPGDRAERIANTERLARRAVALAEQAGLPEVACRALNLLSGLSRLYSYDEAGRHLEHMLAIAEEAGLAAWRVDALLRLGVNAAIRTGDLTRLRQAQQAADELGSIVFGMSTEANIGWQLILRGEHAAAAEIFDRCESAVLRMQNTTEYLIIFRFKATLAAHQGNRVAMERELARYARHGGTSSQQQGMVIGLCHAVCALLEEDRPRATADLDALLAWELANPTVFDVAGRWGLRVLTEALAGRATWAGHAEAASAPASAVRWNQQFLHAAEAVLHGSSDPDSAAEAMGRALHAAEPFPMAAHLIRRLVAEHGIASGWGDPVTWLRAAEEYFHTAGVSPVANACRSLLRQAGASTTQRREGRSDIPRALRDLGVTVREYEVFQLLGEHPGNQGIARQLFISPRTVEKHVASLLVKTGHTDRAALTAYARALDA
ncbi:ATP-binding protein [Longispora albida]|uniref:ATP-binding protein n=1 Tax=Longispora albida TaxID=203523 RepID=UPI000380AA00|nr:LuxR family transcriptional regulator [Longispora albida]